MSDKRKMTESNKNWGKFFTISEDEYTSLRNELIQRILLINSQATNAITVVLTMWAAGLGLFGIQVANLDKFDELHNFILCFGEAGTFFCAILILIPLALKSGENLRQQAAISSYIRFFYYELVKEKKIKSNIIYPWEYVSEVTNEIYINKKNQKRKTLLVMTNAEYPILGLVSFIFTACVLFANYYFVCNFPEFSMDALIFIVLSVIIGILEVIMIIFLYKITSIVKNMTLIIDEKLERYWETARYMGII